MCLCSLSRTFTSNASDWKKLTVILIDVKEPAPLSLNEPNATMKHNAGCFFAADISCLVTFLVSKVDILNLLARFSLTLPFPGSLEQRYH